VVFAVVSPVFGSMRGRKKEREGWQTLKSDLTGSFNTCGTV